MSQASLFMAPLVDMPVVGPAASIQAGAKPPAPAAHPPAAQPQMTGKPLPSHPLCCSASPTAAVVPPASDLVELTMAASSAASSAATAPPPSTPPVPADAIIWPSAYEATGAEALESLQALGGNTSAGREDVLDACRKLKDLGTRMKDRKIGPPSSEGWNTILARAIVDFIQRTATLAADPNQNWDTMTLAEAAVLCYAQDTCVDLHKRFRHELFGQKEWHTLVIGSRKAACLLARQIVDNKLLEQSAGTGNDNAGDKIAIVHYFSTGLQFEPPGKGGVALLHGSHEKYPERSVEVALGTAIACLIKPGVALEGRQIGKLMLSIARIVEVPNIPIDRDALATALSIWSHNPAVVAYHDSVNRGASNFVDPVAVDNLAEAACLFLKAGVISAAQPADIVNRVAVLIARVSAQSTRKPSTANRNSYTNFVQYVCGETNGYPSSALADAWRALGLPARKKKH